MKRAVIELLAWLLRLLLLVGLIVLFALVQLAIGVAVRPQPLPGWVSSLLTGMALGSWLALILRLPLPKNASLLIHGLKEFTSIDIMALFAALFLGYLMVMIGEQGLAIVGLLVLPVGLFAGYLMTLLMREGWVRMSSRGSRAVP